MSTPKAADPDAAVHLMVAANGTELAVTRVGSGRPVLLVHGGGEDAGMLRMQAEGLAAAGFEAIVYDRRGTGASGRADWPGGGAAPHAADAAALIAALGLDDVTVLGLSSGGVIALALAVDHPGCAARVIAWEPPAAGVVPGGADFTAQIMAPVEEHLESHPGDFIGAQAILLGFVLGFPVAVDDPEFAAARANAEQMIVDEPAITLASFTAEQFVGREVIIAIGSSPNELIACAVAILAEFAGRPPVMVDADHEVYLRDTSVLTGIVARATQPS